MNNIKIYPKPIIKTASLTHNKEGSRMIKIRFPFDFDDLSKIRSLPVRAFNREEKYWTSPLNASTLQSLRTWGFKLSDKLETYLLKQIERKNTRQIPIKSIEIPGLKGTLMPFQNIGVSMIESKEGRVLLADEMGLGKTIQTLAWLQLHPELRPVIIVVPASLKLNWERECLKWMNNPSIEILYGTIPFLSIIFSDILIINYDIIPYWKKELKKIKTKVLILDECQYIKNNNAKRTRAIKRLSKSIPHIIALSGTPIENRPIEIYNAWHIIDPENCPTSWDFCMRYCGAKHNGFGWDFSGSSNTQELHELLINSIMIRRLKRNVLPELPDKVYSFIPLEIDNEKDYKLAEDDFIEFVRKTAASTFDKNINKIETKLKSELGDFMEKYDVKEIDFGQHSLSIDNARNSFIEAKVGKAAAAETLSQIEGLKQLAVKGKMKQVINWIDNFLESDQKLVVFARHKFVIDILMNQYNKIAKKIDGSVSMTNRQKAIGHFQNRKSIKLIIISEAGGVGITLTAASNILITEYPWTPGKLDQIIDRLHRIGQKDSVNVHASMAVNTIEERIAKLLDEKRKILDSVLDGKETEAGNLLHELIEQYKEIESLTNTAKDLKSELEKSGKVTFHKKYDWEK